MSPLFGPGIQRGGFSLVELIIATTLLGFLLVVLFSIYPNSIIAVKHAEHRLKAAHLAQSILEQKRAGPFIELDKAITALNIPAADQAIYTPAFECYSVPDTDPSKLKKVRVVVFWREKNREYSIYKECYVCTVHP
jgi:prepilin-type N-terminal cleavage/methylation domain-containing protein